jgi:hypothetical protein
VLSLGRIEWLNRAFHTEKYIWPVGYAARRMARTPAGGGGEVWHTMEVVEADGHPLFRCAAAGEGEGGFWARLLAADRPGAGVRAPDRAARLPCTAPLLRPQPARVTPQGRKPVEGPNPTAAWAALFAGPGGAAGAAGAKGAAAAKDAAAAAARAAGRSGPLLFGLQHPRVRAALQALPGAERLERLLAWEGGERPEVPPLVRPGLLPGDCFSRQPVP